jgi:hypothetical protein
MRSDDNHDAEEGSCMSDIEKFLAERKRVAEEVARVGQLVSRYKSNMPVIRAQWETTERSIQFNEIDEKIVSEGLSIYACSCEALWSGIYEPEIYDTNTLWSECHDARKIAKVIEAWAANVALSPIFLVKHGTLDLGLVADGKHRLTVSRAIRAIEVPFMVAKTAEAWVRTAIPTAMRVF